VTTEPASVGVETWIEPPFFCDHCENVSIGDRVQVGSRVELRAAEPITIGNDAWLGSGVIVLPGVTIGARAVVGAGSVVTQDVPADCVVVGNPARPLRAVVHA
jgi:maltose O-acetyltransferase